MPDDLTALRDRLAVACRWWIGEMGEWCHEQHGTKLDHPFPAGDLTALAAAWPEGWWINGGRLRPGVWGFIAGPDAAGAATHRSGDAPTEYEARLRLTVAVREAMGKDEA